MDDLAEREVVTDSDDEYFESCWAEFTDYAGLDDGLNAAFGQLPTVSNCAPPPSSSSSCEADTPAPSTSTATSATSGRRTGIVFDVRMLGHEGDTTHPERPNRLRSIGLGLLGSGLLPSCVRIAARPASDDEYRLVHSAEQVQSVQARAARLASARDNRKLLASIDSDTYMSVDSLAAASVAAGGVIEAVRAAVTGRVANAFAVVRPPGHHATADEAMGFCLFDNVAIAAEAAVQQLGVQRVLIVDWDVHHGNGVQDIFASRSDVLYVSLHRHPFYPSTGAPENLGTAAGAGYSVNVAWPRAGFGDADYVHAFERVLLPLARHYRPQLVLVASGFDAALGDPLGMTCVTPACYHWMTAALVSLGAPVVVALEGGYDLAAISASAVEVVRALLALPSAAQQPRSTDRQSDTPAIVDHLVQLLQPYWPCLAPPPPPPPPPMTALARSSAVSGADISAGAARLKPTVTRVRHRDGTVTEEQMGSDGNVVVLDRKREVLPAFLADMSQGVSSLPPWRFDAASGSWQRLPYEQHTDDSATTAGGGEALACSLSLVTYNVWFSEWMLAERAAQLLRVVDDCHADVVCLQEVTQPFLDIVVAQPCIRQHYWLSDAAGNSCVPYGAVVLWRAEHPLFAGAGARVVVRALPSNMGRRCVELSVPSRGVTIATAHLESRLNTAMRVAQIDLIFPHLAQQRLGVFLGDTNFPDDSPEQRHVVDAYPSCTDVWLALHSADAAARTQPTVTDRFGRIDKVYCVSGCGAATPTAMRMIGTEPFDTCPRTHSAVYPSDHFGLYACFELNL